MKRRTNDELTRLANAAFERAAEKVIARALASGTPVIVCLDGEVKAVAPQKARSAGKGTQRALRKPRRAE